MIDRSARRAAVATAILLAVIAAIVVAGLPLYVFPPADDVDRADLVYVIGPPQRDRIAAERALRSAGAAPMSLYSVSMHGGWSAERLPVCGAPSVTCVHPEPFTTKGEIAYLAEFAEEHDVHSTIVLTFTPHVARTRYILAKCFAGAAVVVGVDQHLDLGTWIAQYGYQTLALVKAWLTPCADETDL